MKNFAMAATDDWLLKYDSEFLLVLRSLSILVIVFGHVGGFWVYRPYSEFLHVFVAIFFFISGAVSYNGFLKSKSIATYIKKRAVGLLVPYYGICIISLVLYVSIYLSLPAFSWRNFLKWITIIPNNSIMTFPVGQVWFLHALMIISLISPLLFLLYRRYVLIF